jgi:hypothetical protein
VFSTTPSVKPNRAAFITTTRVIGLSSARQSTTSRM